MSDVFACEVLTSSSPTADYLPLSQSALLTFISLLMQLLEAQVSLWPPPGRWGPIHLLPPNPLSTVHCPATLARLQLQWCEKALRCLPALSPSSILNSSHIVQGFAVAQARFRILSTSRTE